MSEQDQHSNENDEKSSTLVGERDSQDEIDFDSLFADNENNDEDTPVTRAELEQWKKGAQKLATEIGRIKKANAEKSPEVKAIENGAPRVASEDNPILKSLYLKANPDAAIIWDEVEKEAKLLGKDPYSLYESSSYFKGEAKARAEAKSREETNKNKVKSPTSQMVNGNVDYSNVSDSDIANMSIQEFEKFSDWKAAQSKK
ncbi:MAG: hypothetical protein IPO02_11995 [Bacteroidetes bacterium]|nr:hypothetical protein [Bacteroidota bacterium]